MKKLFIICLLLAGLLTACGSQSDDRIAIAILTPITHPSLEQIEKGFIETMEASHPSKFKFVTYNAQGNTSLLRSEIEEIAHKEYALVFTITTIASQMTTEVFSKKGLETPIVFTCVNDPEGFHIKGANVTGVRELLDFEEEIASLLKHKPELKSLLLVYNPHQPGLQKDQEQIRRILNDKKIALTTVEVFKTNEIKAKVEPFMEQIEAIIVIKDNTVISGLDALIKLCNQYKIPLMTSDLDSPDRGAAFGYGVYEIEFGIEGAKKALNILKDGIPPSAIPVTPVKTFSLKVNTEAALKQGVKL